MTRASESSSGLFLELTNYTNYMPAYNLYVSINSWNKAEDAQAETCRLKYK
jgi:hypothetical protein